MRTFSETKHLPFAAHDLYEIVVDVDRYDEFLPWCVASRVRERRDDGTRAIDSRVMDALIRFEQIRRQNRLAEGGAPHQPADPAEPTNEQVAAAMQIFEGLPEMLAASLRPILMDLTEVQGMTHERALVTVLANIDYYIQRAPQQAGALIMPSPVC